MNYYIIVFKNTHDAMSAEKKLEELNYEFEIMPTPTSITLSCGICVRIGNKAIIDSILSSKALEFKNIYLKTDKGYELFN